MFRAQPMSGSSGVAQRRYDALLIDFYGTISAGDRLAVEGACQKIVETFRLSMSAAEFAVLWGERFFRSIEACNHHAFRTLHECELTSLQDTLRPLVGEMDPVPFVAEIEAYWAAPPIHADAIEFLGRVDLPICCVSNADNAPLFSAIERHGLRFDHVITSEAVRCYKPDAEIFRRAVERLGVDPARTMHVGDSLQSDIGGASKLGITTIWVCRDDRIHDIGTSEPNYTISSLAELSAVLAD